MVQAKPMNPVTASAYLSSLLLRPGRVAVRVLLLLFLLLLSLLPGTLQVPAEPSDSGGRLPSCIVVSPHQLTSGPARTAKGGMVVLMEHVCVLLIREAWTEHGDKGTKSGISHRVVVILAA